MSLGDSRTATSACAKSAAGIAVTAMIHQTALARTAHLLGKFASHHTRAVARLRGLGQQLSHAKMREHDVGCPVHRFVVGPFESFAFHRGMEQAVDLLQEVLHVVIGHVAAVVFQQVIDANEQIGDRVKPCEPGISLKEFEQAVHGLDRSVDAFVSQLFGNDESAVKPDEAFADREDRAPARIDRNERSGLG